MKMRKAHRANQAGRRTPQMVDQPPLNSIAVTNKSIALIPALIPMVAIIEEDSMVDSYPSALTALLQHHSLDETAEEEELKQQQDGKGHPEQDQISHKRCNKKLSTTSSHPSSHTSQQSLFWKNNSSMSMIFPDSVGLTKAQSDRTMSTSEMSTSGDDHHRLQTRVVARQYINK